MNDKQTSRLSPIANLNANSLLINEIFLSIQGESSYAGQLCVFVRTTACNLRCSYCDTQYAFFNGEQLSLPNIIEQIDQFGVSLVEITGGEPLLQPAVFELTKTLCNKGHTVLLETNGTVEVQNVDPRAIKIIDIKTPGSGEEKNNLYSNIAKLQPKDEVKFVLTTKEDYDWAKNTINHYQLFNRCQILMSAAFGYLTPNQLAEWIVADRIPVRMQLQLHKYIWDPHKEGV
ncbi:MAG: radical SAM protein [Deltaproteobacteria bacterium]|nr:radical SAM protein [Deltaproteobacteria bacterium]